MTCQTPFSATGLDKEEAANKPYIASMGIYVFKKAKLLDLLEKQFPHDMDFGGEILPKSLETCKVCAKAAAAAQRHVRGV